MLTSNGENLSVHSRETLLLWQLAYCFFSQRGSQLISQSFVITGMLFSYLTETSNVMRISIYVVQF